MPYGIIWLKARINLPKCLKTFSDCLVACSVIPFLQWWSQSQEIYTPFGWYKEQLFVFVFRIPCGRLRCLLCLNGTLRYNDLLGEAGQWRNEQQQQELLQKCAKQFHKWPWWLWHWCKDLCVSSWIFHLIHVTKLLCLRIFLFFLFNQIH